MLDLRPHRTAPLLCRLFCSFAGLAGLGACTPPGDPGDDHALGRGPVAAATEPALKHRVMTASTNLVAVEQRSEANADGTLRTVEVPLELPQAMQPPGPIGTGRDGGGHDDARGAGVGSGYGLGAGAGFGGRGTRVPTVRQGKPEAAPGGYDKDVIRRHVRAHIHEVRRCYEQGLARDPNLKGRVRVRFTIGPKGTVIAAELAEQTLGEATVGACIVDAVKRWTFPQPEGGPAVIIYPFMLEPG